ncbi:hypothetical protein E4T39_02891 [Aureobasidium subglaciale]|nr:hypothetical protein E4T39_02891 [Aureobasidium subglaciale]
MCLAIPSPGDGVVVQKHEAAKRITNIKSNSDGSNSTPARSLTWRGSVEELLGFRVEEIPTSESWWLTKIHPDDLFDVVNSLSRILAPAPDKPYASEARIWAHNYRFRHANGQFLLISERSIIDRDEGGNALSMTSTIFDAEKRRVERKAHREFLDSRNQFALISNNTPSGIWMMDPHGYTTYMNKAAESITGFKFEEIAGWTFHAAIHSCKPDGSPYPVAECPIFRHQQSGTEATNESEVFVHKNGSFYGDYASGGAVIEFRDVTSQKRLEKERLAAIVQNEQQSGMYARKSLHLQNVAILTFPGTLSQYWSYLSRLDAGKVEPSYDIVDLRALSSEAVEMMASRARVKSINLRLANNDASPLYLKADSTLMSQIMLNLIGNAVKFTPENGNIVVDIHCEPPDDKGNVIFHGSVTDDGVGMTEEEQQRLFKRFSQANKRVAQTYKGSGLGLSISKEIVKVLGGDMAVKSIPGAGSTFGFFTMHDYPTKDELTAFLKSGNGVTAVAADLEKFEISNSGMISSPPKFKKICVAEDNPINLRHLAKNLEALGYETPILCTNGKEALDSFTQPDSDIDAVIIDMSMPTMDGLEATRLMRKYEKFQSPARKRIPIIALSGNAMKEQVQEAMTAGTSDYMIKPCKRAQLKMMLEYWERVSHDGSLHTPLVVK